MKALQLFCLFTLIMTASSSYAQDVDVVGNYTSLGGAQHEIRALIAENEVGVLLEIGSYTPDIVDGSSGLLRSIWFVLEQNEIPTFIKFLDTISLNYELLQRSGKDNTFIKGTNLPEIGTCMVADFHAQNGFIASEGGTSTEPFFHFNRSAGKNVIHFSYYFYDDNHKQITCGFYFDSAEDINSLRDTLNNLLPRYLRVN